MIKIYIYILTKTNQETQTAEWQVIDYSQHHEVLIEKAL